MVNQVFMADFTQVLAVRQMLEVEAVGFAVCHKDRAHELINENAELLERDDVTPGEHRQLDKRIYEDIAQASGNDVLLRYIVTLQRLTVMFDKKRTPHHFEKSCYHHVEHKGVLSAIADSDASRPMLEW
jgi:DNA-binding FadR family transcriptional regulator